MKNLVKNLFRMFTFVLSVLCATMFVACGQKDANPANNGGSGNGGSGSGGSGNGSESNAVYQEYVQRQESFAAELNKLANENESYTISKETLGEAYKSQIGDVTLIGDNYFAADNNLYVKDGEDYVNVVPDKCGFAPEISKYEILDVKDTYALVISTIDENEAEFSVFDFSNLEDVKKVVSFNNYWWNDATLYDSYLIDSNDVIHFFADNSKSEVLDGCYYWNISKSKLIIDINQENGDYKIYDVVTKQL